jgi:hypothetical protein
MTMAFEETLAFKLPNGKTLGTATAECSVANRLGIFLGVIILALGIFVV